jgi:hypothetical protein
MTNKKKRMPETWDLEIITDILAQHSEFDHNLEGYAELITAAPKMRKVLREELQALKIWQAAALPKDVRQGVGISISKILAVLSEITSD